MIVARHALVLVVAAFGLAFGCGKNEGKSSASSSSTTPVASALPSAEVSAKPNVDSTELTGAYDAKLATVRTPDDAPPFEGVTTGAIGAGTLDLALPNPSGLVVGRSSGALGAQIFSGLLDGDRLTGTLRPEPGDAVAMWGLVDAKVTGAGDGRVVEGSIRASSSDGRVVREAGFTLKKK